MPVLRPVDPTSGGLLGRRLRPAYDPRQEIAHGFQQIEEAILRHTDRRARMAEKEAELQRERDRLQQEASDLASVLAPRIRPGAVEVQERVPGTGPPLAEVLRARSEVPVSIEPTTLAGQLGTYGQAIERGYVGNREPLPFAPTEYRTTTEERPGAQSLAEVLADPTLTDQQRGMILRNPTLATSLITGEREAGERRKSEDFGKQIAAIRDDAVKEAERTGEHWTTAFTRKVGEAMKTHPNPAAFMDKVIKWSTSAEAIEGKREAKAAIGQAQAYIGALMEQGIPRGEALRRGLQKYGASLPAEGRTLLERTYQPTVEEKAGEISKTEELTRPAKIQTAVETKKAVGPVEQQQAIDQAIARFKALTPLELNRFKREQQIRHADDPTYQMAKAAIKGEGLGALSTDEVRQKVLGSSNVGERARKALEQWDRGEPVTDPQMAAFMETRPDLVEALARDPTDPMEKLARFLGGRGGAKTPREPAKPPPAPVTPSQGHRETPGLPQVKPTGVRSEVLTEARQTLRQLAPTDPAYAQKVEKAIRGLLTRQLVTPAEADALRREFGQRP